MDLVKRIMVPLQNDHLSAETDGDSYTNESSTKQDKINKSAKKKKIDSEEVQMLRKEIEEMKFYQELEQTEYQEMKQKMHNYEKQMKEMAAKKSEAKSKAPVGKLANVEEESEMHSEVDTVDLMAIYTSESNVKAKSSPSKDVKIQKKDSQIKQLKDKLHEKVANAKESSNKLKNMAKEYEKRFNKIETMKDEEIEEIKGHYKSMMETLAKQLQKASRRFNEEEEKNKKLKAMMLEMRNDMEAREKELEEKIKLQQAAVKKNNVKVKDIEIKLERTGSKYSLIKTELDAASKAKEEYAKRLQIMEQKHEEAISEVEKNNEKKMEALREAHDRETAALQSSVEDEIEGLTAKLLDMEKLFDEEAAEHDKTSARVRGLEEEINEKEEQITELTEKLEILREESNNYNDRAKTLAQDELSDLMETKEKLIALETDIKVLNVDKLKKKEMLKKYADEVESLHAQIQSMADAFHKEAKIKDLEFVKAKKKWSILEGKLNEEIKELKEINQKFGALLETASGQIVVETAVEDRKLINSQKKLIEQLKADKATLQLRLANFEGKKNLEILQLKKQLGVEKMTTYERKLSQSLNTEVEEEMDNQIDAGDDTRDNFANDNEVEKSNIESQPSEQESTGSTFIVNVSKKAVPVVHVQQPSQRGMSSQNSYRNFVRNKKFSKKNLVGNE